MPVVAVSSSARHRFSKQAVDAVIEVTGLRNPACTSPASGTA